MNRITVLGLTVAAAASFLAPAAQADEVCLPIVRYTQVHPICISIER